MQIGVERVSCWDKDHRTNNGAESLHSRLNKGIRGYPKFWAYPDKIKGVCTRFVTDVRRLQQGLRVTRPKLKSKVQQAISKYSDDFRVDGDIGKFIKRCRYLAEKSEHAAEDLGEEFVDPGPAAPATPPPAGTPPPAVTPPPANLQPATPVTGPPARRTRAARRRLDREVEEEILAATQPVPR